MTPYIVNLTDQLIREYGFDMHAGINDREKFIKDTEATLTSYYGPMKKYSFETLGRIIFACEEVIPGSKISFAFEGTPGKALRALTAQCLTLAICERLIPTPGSTVPLFVRKKKKD